jgi:hypothetical protein
MHISVRCDLSTSEGVELSELAEIAGGILDHSTHSQVMATDNPRSELPTSSQQPIVDFSEERLANVEKQLSEHASVVKSIQTSLKTSNTSELRSRSATPPEEIICRSHRKFRDNAQVAFCHAATNPLNPRKN